MKMIRGLKKGLHHCVDEYVRAQHTWKTYCEKKA